MRTLVHWQLRTGPPFLPTLCKFCFLRYCQASQTEISKQNSTTFAKRRMINRANNMLYNSWGCPPRKYWGPRNFNICSVFNGKYLLNETWYRQSGNGAGKYEGSSRLSKNFMNFGPQTASNGTGLFCPPSLFCSVTLHCTPSNRH